MSLCTRVYVCLHMCVCECVFVGVEESANVIKEQEKNLVVA